MEAPALNHADSEPIHRRRGGPSWSESVPIDAQRYTPTIRLTLDPAIEARLQRELAAGNYAEPSVLLHMPPPNAPNLAPVDLA
jgi:hypothetical protein